MGSQGEEHQEIWPEFHWVKAPSNGHQHSASILHLDRNRITRSEAEHQHDKRQGCATGTLLPSKAAIRARQECG